MIHATEPVNFKPKFEVVGCFVEYEGSILLLLRQSHKPYGGTWSVPGGKVEQSEDATWAMVRELEEETGLKVSVCQLKYFKKIFVRGPDFDLTYHIYSIRFVCRPDIHINEDEHQHYQWIMPQQALSDILVHDLGDCIKLYYQLS